MGWERLRLLAAATVACGVAGASARAEPLRDGATGAEFMAAPMAARVAALTPLAAAWKRGTKPTAPSRETVALGVFELGNCIETALTPDRFGDIAAAARLREQPLPQLVLMCALLIDVENRSGTRRGR